MTEELYNKRKDLQLHRAHSYLEQSLQRDRSWTITTFGAIKPRVAAFMEELDEELWKLGILAKTEHNEVAPAQHELAPIFCSTNIATDHNQLTMEMMKQSCKKVTVLVCLFA